MNINIQDKLKQVECKRRLDELEAQLVTMTSDRDRHRIAIENLTPMGSDFHNNLDKCVEYISKESDRQNLRNKRFLSTISKLREEIRSLNKNTKGEDQC